MSEQVKRQREEGDQLETFTRKCEQLVLERHRPEISKMEALVTRIRSCFPNVDLKVVLADRRLVLLVTKGDRHPVSIVIYPEFDQACFQVCSSPGKGESSFAHLEYAVNQLKEALCLEAV